MEKLYKAILIYGPPGSGKGTISKFLNLSDSIYHLSMGDIFRSLDADTKEGKEVKDYLKKGLLLPDDLTIRVWHSFVKDLIVSGRYNPDKQFLLLDGIPRTIKQAVLLEKYIKVAYVIVLQMENVDKLIERMKNRALIENRSDDADINVLKKRMQVYQDDTSKLLQHYPENIIFKVNADQKRLQVVRDVLIKIADHIE